MLKDYFSASHLLCMSVFFLLLLWISFVWKCIFSFSNWTYLKVTLQCEFHKMYAYSSSVRFDRWYVQISSRLECYNTGRKLTEKFELPQPFHENIKIFHEINTDCHPKLHGRKSTEKCPSSNPSICFHSISLHVVNYQQIGLFRQKIGWFNFLFFNYFYTWFICLRLNSTIHNSPKKRSIWIWIWFARMHMILEAFRSKKSPKNVVRYRSHNNAKSCDFFFTEKSIIFHGNRANKVVSIV